MLGLAGAALLTDKLFLSPNSGPAAAHGSVAPSAGTPTAIAGAAQSPRSRAEATGSELAERLRLAGAMLPRTPVNDAFFLPSAWRESQDATPSTPAESNSSDEPSQITTARNTLKLTAVVLGAQPVAVIDGMPYRLGDVVGGLLLTEIFARSATLKHEATGVQLELRLADRPANDRSLRVSPRTGEGTSEKSPEDSASDQHKPKEAEPGK